MNAGLLIFLYFIFDMFCLICGTIGAYLLIQIYILDANIEYTHKQDLNVKKGTVVKINVKDFISKLKIAKE